MSCSIMFSKKQLYGELHIAPRYLKYH